MSEKLSKRAPAYPAAKPARPSVWLASLTSATTLLANVYLHWFDVMFHRQNGPRHWANARLVRYADDFVVMARYQGYRIDEWLDAKLEGWLGLNNNREKTKVVHLDQAESLDFLGFNRRSQRKYHRPQGMSLYQYLQEPGLQRL